MIKLCCFNQDNPHFLAFKRRAAELAASKTLPLKRINGPVLARLNPLHYHVCSTMMINDHKTPAEAKE